MFLEIWQIAEFARCPSRSDRTATRRVGVQNGPPPGKFNCRAAGLKGESSMERFTGPYTMPKGAGGRVPPVSGSGQLSPPGGAMPPRGGLNFPARGNPNAGWWGAGSRAARDLSKYGGGYAALANLDPAATRHAARQLDAYLSQFMPDWYWGFQGDSDWFKTATTAEQQRPRYTFPAGWITNCQVLGNPAKISGVGFNPYTGHPPAVINTCSVGTIGAQNAPYGTSVPPEAIQVQECESNNPFPSTDGFPFAIHTKVNGDLMPVFSPGTGVIVLPMDDPFSYPQGQTQMQPSPEGRTSNRVVVGLRPYEVEAASVTIPGKGPPVKNPDDVHLNVPPGRGEREEKHIDNRGKSIGDVYGAFTEADDVAKCVLKSVGKKDWGSLRKQGFNPYGKPQRAAMAAAAAVQGKVDWKAALTCVALNNAQDEVVGRLSRAGSRRLQHSEYSPRRTSPVGWGVGGFSTRMR